MPKSRTRRLPKSAKALDRLVATYPDLDPTTPSSYIFINEDGEHQAQLLQVCAASLRYAPNRFNFSDILFACPKQDDVSLLYINWLINHPFKRFKDQIKLDKHNDNYYIHVKGLDTFPANALFNFAIATRAPIEFELTMDMWSKLMGLGLTPGLANVIAGLVQVKPDNHLYVEPSLDAKLNMVGPQHVGHWWLDNHSSWDQVLTGNMVGLSEPYKLAGSCVPASDIWGYQNNTYGLFENFTLRQLMEQYPNEL